METNSPASPSWKLELVDDSRPPVEEPLPVVTPGLTLVHDAAPILDLAPLAPGGTPAHGGGWSPGNPGLTPVDTAAPQPPVPQPPALQPLALQPRRPNLRRPNPRHPGPRPARRSPPPTAMSTPPPVPRFPAATGISPRRRGNS